jgi:hypothetical protein
MHCPLTKLFPIAVKTSSGVGILEGMPLWSLQVNAPAMDEPGRAWGLLEEELQVDLVCKSMKDGPSYLPNSAK